MIAFRGTNSNGKVNIGLVLSNENVVRLVNGEPIVIPGSNAGLDSNIEITIHYAERDEFVAAAEAQGLITEETNVVFTG